MGREVEFKPYRQHQGQLFPAHLSEALDPSDPAFFIDEVVEGLDLRRFEKRYARRGEHAYAPRMLLKLWRYAATRGVYSGRELARKIPRDLGFRYLAGEGPYPDFRTINRFRVRHRKDFAGVLRQTVRVAQSLGLGKLGRVAIDGTEIQADTSRHKAMSHGTMRAVEARLEDEIQQILAQMEELNAAEDEAYGEDDDGSGGLPAELQDRERRREKIRAVREQLEREKEAELKPTHQKSLADPEAQMMKLGDGSLQYAYNAQSAASEEGLIVATGMTRSPNDQRQLVPMVEAVEANTGEKPGRVLADNGYVSERGLEALARRGQACLVAVGREGRKPKRWPRGPYTKRMHRVLRFPWARAEYAHRKTQGERPLALIKRRMRFRRFSVRGYVKACGEWDLVCSAYNLLAIGWLVEARG
jgi:transposase